MIFLFHETWESNLQNEHKIQSRGSSDVSITLSRVPKALGVIRHFWLPNAMIVSFKLETDGSILIEKAMKSIEMYHMDCVIANMLHTRQHVVQICSEKADPLEVRKPDNDTHIEEPLVSELINMHSVKMTKSV